MNFNYIGINRYFNLFSVLSKNHYAALGLNCKATQGEIKAAYYKLSMIYHPDKNEGSESASEKFRDITAAYEVLGNVKSRRLYDRGFSGESEAAIMNWKTTSPNNTKGAKVQTGTRFSGRSPIYDFDEWSKTHYGLNFERRTQAKKRYEDMILKSERTERREHRDLLIYGVVSLMCTFALLMYATKFPDLDSPPEKPTNPKKM